MTMWPTPQRELFDTVLIANRGEIAVRVARTLRAMGIRSVAGYSDADADAAHVAAADLAVRLGPAPAAESYLNIERIVDAAVRMGAQAVHPGYGFLSENAAFATALAEAGIAFLGPPAAAIATMGDKIAAKQAVAAVGVPVVPGISMPDASDAELVSAARQIGFPLLVKPAAGGGGKGMRLVHEPAELPEALASARREAAGAFGDDSLLLERFVTPARHIEVQVLADRHGRVLHMGERECSLQRRHQKVIEEAPSPLLDAETRSRMGDSACAVARSVDYVGVGTVEFIVRADRPAEFYFLEMNTRLQVEHAVTELVTGVDLVECQVRVAAGQPLGANQSDIRCRGYAIEARVYAEDPARDFLPTGGLVLALAEPSDPGVRVDSGIQAGTVVGSDYDPMLAKVIAHGASRAEALGALDRALAETLVLGVRTNIEFLRSLLSDANVIAGELDTELVDRRVENFTPAPVRDEQFFAAAAFAWLRQWPANPRDRWEIPDGWRLTVPAPTTFRLAGGERTVHVSIVGRPDNAQIWCGECDRHTLVASLEADALVMTLDGVRQRWRVATEDSQLWVADSAGMAVIREVSEVSTRADAEHVGDAEIRSPMPGSVIALAVDNGATVDAGDPVVVVSAMKMEHTLTAPVPGTVELAVGLGDQVTLDQLLARILPGSPTR